LCCVTKLHFLEWDDHVMIKLFNQLLDMPYLK
jgi:hypothetical protein